MALTRPVSKRRTVYWSASSRRAHQGHGRGRGDSDLYLSPCPMSSPLPHAPSHVAPDQARAAVIQSRATQDWGRPHSALVPDPQLTTLITLIRSRYPIIYVQTSEERRVIQTLQTWASVIRGDQGYVYGWSCAAGYHPLTTTPAGGAGMTDDSWPRSPDGARDMPPTSSTSPVLTTLRSEDILQNLAETLDTLAGKCGNGELALHILLDVHHYIRYPSISRRLKDVATWLRGTDHTVLLVSPTLDIPPELDKDIAIAPFPLPNPQERELQIAQYYATLRRDATEFRDAYAPALQDALTRASAGLTQTEIEHALSRGFVEGGGFTQAMVESVYQTKRAMLQHLDCLEAVATEDVSALGGLDVFKTYIDERRRSWGEDARAFGVAPPRGLVAIGVPGSGKSLGARVIAHRWQLPLIRLNVGALFDKYLGESERKLTIALHTLDALAPVVVWIDEAGDAFTDVGNGGGADGASQATGRVHAEFLNWLQERPSGVFVYCTANSIRRVPPQLFRRGRMDEIFFFDLPTAREREAIFRIHLTACHRDPASFDLPMLVRASMGFVGAEIASVVNDALVSAFADRERGACDDMTTAHLLAALRRTVPLAKAEHEKIVEMRAVVQQGRARPASSEPPTD